MKIHIYNENNNFKNFCGSYDRAVIPEALSNYKKKDICKKCLKMYKKTGQKVKI